MRVLGIDPGTVTMGYGLIEGEDEELNVLDYGVITASKRLSLIDRLHELYVGLLELVTSCQPDEIAIEEPFVARNARSALAMGQAQALAILAARINSIPIHAYAPSRVKQAVADYGSSKKDQIQEMVRIQLGLPQIPQPSDSADALAVAICHFREKKINKLIMQSE